MLKLIFCRSNWCQNKLFRGSWTTFQRGFSLQSGATMLTPLYSKDGKPALMFAGEAYHHRLASSMPAAYETGKQQAQVILKQQ